MTTRFAVAVLALVASAAAAGCGFGEGEASEGEATLAVTRDYGAETMLEASVSDPPESETVIRMLDREAEITTRFGGGFVHSIDGVAGEIVDGRTRDWFFFVNGIESSRGAAEVTVRGGDRIWWDYRDWTAALRTPAVVGSWPEPFAQESAGDDAVPVRVQCAGEPAPCELVSERLADEGVDAPVTRDGGGGDALRLLVGPFASVRAAAPANQLASGPQTSGVFARFRSSGAGTALAALDERGEEARLLGPSAGLVAGLRRGEDRPTWVVTGTDEAGVTAAARLLDEAHLAHRYAVAVADGVEVPLPVSE